MMSLFNKAFKNKGLTQEEGWNTVTSNLSNLSIEKQRTVLEIGSKHPDAMISAKCDYLLARLAVEDLRNDSDFADVFAFIGA